MSTYTYKNARAAVGNSYATVYTVPAATTTILFSAHAANIDGSNTVTFSLQWLDASAGSAATRICNAVPISINTPSYEAIEAPKTLETGDVVQAAAGATGDVELTLAIVEIS